MTGRGAPDGADALAVGYRLPEEREGGRRAHVEAVDELLRPHAGVEDVERAAAAARSRDVDVDDQVGGGVARRLRAGNVRVNAATALDFAMPFGGMKLSGWGRENGREGVESFTELKSVAIDLQ